MNLYPTNDVKYPICLAYYNHFEDQKTSSKPILPSLVIVGLGNPGPEYAGTRHNAGFWCVDALADKHGIALKRRNRSAIIGEGEIEDHRVVLVKPRTFVNQSGAAINYLTARYAAPIAKLLIVCDDIQPAARQAAGAAQGQRGGTQRH